MNIFKVGMTSLVFWSLLVSLLITVAFYEWYQALAGVPLAWTIVWSAVGFIYAIDRYGFKKFDTVEYLFNNPHEYKWWICIYSAVVLASFLLAFWVTGSL